jgi:hypothetical protein
MPDVWEYREPQELPQRHPPTEVVPPQQNRRYSQAEHIRNLEPLHIDDFPAAGRRPAFTPAPRPPQPPSRQPRGQGAGDAWGALPDDPWLASTGQPSAPRYQPQPGYQPPPSPPARYTPPPQYSPGPPQRSRHTARNVLAGIGCLVALIIVISAAANSGHSTTSAGPSIQAQAAASGAQPPAGPSGTTSELQALAAAQDYLSDGQGFSKQGLIDQLDSASGDNFSVADATWGVDHSAANWDDQAVDCAKDYMADGQGFSREGLIQQMTSAYGDKFTEAQAEYAANAVGL